MKIRARAPLRLGLAGGGTDVSPFCDLHGGYVLNATIDMYAFASIELTREPVVRFDAVDLGKHFESTPQPLLDCTGPLALHCGVYNRVVKDFCNGSPFGVRVSTHSDAPPGSGLGSSSTMVVAILQAYVEALNLPLGEYEIAHLAYEIERTDLKLSGGRQDQYAATFGGFNFMEFAANDRVLVNPLRVKPWIVNELEVSLLLLYTGVSRASAKVIDQQIHNMVEDSTATDAFLRVKQEALDMKAALLKGDFDVFVESMKAGWAFKKRTASGVSNSNIDTIYEIAISAGAKAGKISGAGGGGFMIFFVDPAVRPKVARAIAQYGQPYGFHFVQYGSQGWRLG